MKAVVKVAVMEAVMEAVVVVEEDVEALAATDLLAVMEDVEMTATEGIAFSQSIIRIYQFQSSVCKKYCALCTQLDTTLLDVVF